MTHPDCLETPKLHLLQQLFASATHDASAAMCRWTNSLISLTLDEVCELPLEDACTDLNVGDELLTMVVLNLEGELGGAMVLTFNEPGGRRLGRLAAASRTQRRPRVERNGTIGVGGNGEHPRLRLRERHLRG